MNDIVFAAIMTIGASIVFGFALYGLVVGLAWVLWGRRQDQTTPRA